VGDAITSQAGKQACMAMEIKRKLKGGRQRTYKDQSPQGAGAGAGLSLPDPDPDLGAAGSDVFGLGLLTSHRTKGNMEGGTLLASPKQMQQQWQDVGAHTGTHAHPIYSSTGETQKDSGIGIDVA